MKVILPNGEIGTAITYYPYNANNKTFHGDVMFETGIWYCINFKLLL